MTRLTVRLALATLALLVPAPASAAWRQHPGPIVTPTQPWEGTAVYEPAVLHEHGRYRMWYTGGWAGAASTGYATSRDGIHWRKHGRVIGHGASGVPGFTARNDVVRDGHRLIMFFVTGVWDGEQRYHAATSRDGIHWHDHGPIMAQGGWDAEQAGNLSAIRRGGRWRLLYEAATAAPRTWAVGLAPPSATPFRFANAPAPLTGIGWPGACYGGPNFAAGTLYYHACPAGQDYTPTDIYRARGRFGSWARGPRILTRSQGWEVDQVADPCRVGRLLFFDGDDNMREAAAIGVAAR